MKIAVIGYSGSGKSTLAKFMGKKYDIPVLYLDTVQWLPGWKEQTQDKKLSIVESFLDNNDSWVIDGNYSRLFYSRRLEEADKIFFLNFNRFSCLYRAFKRRFKYRGRTRESMTENCNEKLDFEFIRWILHDGRTKSEVKRYRDVCEKYPDKVTVIKNQKELDKFIK